MLENNITAKASMSILKNKISLGSSSALFSLLQDSNESVASLAMEQILQLPDFEAQIRSAQDSSEPMLRRRVHQLSSIARRREYMGQFLRSALKGRIGLWRAMLLLDHLYDQQSSFSYLESMSKALIHEFSSSRGGSNSLARFMREHKFCVPGDNWFDVGNHLLGDVLESRVGSSALLCIIAQHIGSFRGWHSHIVLHQGRYCLLDQNLSMIDPSEDWKLHRKLKDELYHICDSKAVLTSIISQLFAFALVNWDPWEIHLFSKMLLSMAKLGAEELPYPLGNYNSPTVKKTGEG